MSTRRLESERLVKRARTRILGATLLGALLIVVLSGAAAIGAVTAGIGHADDSRLTSAARSFARILGGSTTEPADGDTTGPNNSDLVGDEVERTSGIIIVVVDSAGVIVGPVSRPALTDLVDRSAMTVAQVTGLDLRDHSALLGGLPVQLRTATVPVLAAGRQTGQYVIAALPRGDVAGERSTLLLALLAAAVISVGLAVLITLVVTRRALSPVREAFDRERRLLADASHEMRTPVAVITAAADLLEREGAVDPASRSVLADLRAEADRLGRVVAETLSLARLETPGADPGLVMERVDIRALVADVIRLDDLLSVANPVHLETNLGIGPIWVLGDRARLLGALLALVENAKRVSPAGSIVRITAAVEHDNAIIRVDDAGPGIPKAERERAFRPFARLAPGFDGEGTGLGLSLARAVAEAHGGTLMALESPAGGARLEMRLPLDG